MRRGIWVWGRHRGKRGVGVVIEGRPPGKGRGRVVEEGEGRKGKNVGRGSGTLGVREGHKKAVGEERKKKMLG